MKKFLHKITMIVVAVALFFAPYESLIIHLVSADTSYKYLSDIQEAYVKVGYGTFKKNKNESNEMISLMIEHQRTYSMNALYAHAPSSIIYNLHDYTKMLVEVMLVMLYSIFMVLKQIAMRKMNGNY